VHSLHPDEEARKKRIAILGGGPIGLEAALYARALGYDVRVYERGEVGASVRRWGFVRLFSPWELNVSPLGLEALRGRGRPPPDLEAFPTGSELVDDYLVPVAETLGEAVETGVEVLGVSKLGLLKGENLGGGRRLQAPFRLLLRRASGEDLEAWADMVLDATGVYATPRCLGDGGIPALGELESRASIAYHLVDIAGTERASYAGKTTLLVGAGFSAATSLLALLSLADRDPSTRVYWARRSSGPDPFPLYSPDPLPDRARLAREGNRIAAEPPQALTTLPGVVVKALHPEGARLRVELRQVEGGATPETVTVDRVIANVGYRPATEVTRELHVHHCYASEGPMGLAAALLAADARGGAGDCLAETGHGPDTLRTPEPGFFIIGHKSYGRRSDFLLRLGREQVRDIFRLVEGDPELDLYGEELTRGGSGS
jgi:hypothetical protein